MRIALIALCLVLSACAGQDQTPAASKKAILGAEAYCASKGLRPGSLNYQTCYKNRPEVQAFERNARLSDAAIILKNRSVYSSYRGRSYPVE